MMVIQAITAMITGCRYEGFLRYNLQSSSPQRSGGKPIFRTVLASMVAQGVEAHCFNDGKWVVVG